MDTWFAQSPFQVCLLWNLSQTDRDCSWDGRWNGIGMGWKAALTFGVIPAILHLLAHVDVVSRALHKTSTRATVCCA